MNRWRRGKTSREGQANFIRFMIPLFAQPPRSRRRPQLIAAAVAAVSLAAIGLWVRPTPEQLQSSFGATGPYAPLVFIASGVVLITGFVPKTIVSVAAGALFGTTVGLLVMVVVAVGAAALNYWIARILARDHWARWSAGRPYWDAVRRVTEQGGFRLHLLLRFSPIPTMVIGYACGAAGARLVPFLLAAGTAVAGQVLWIYSGAVASEMLTQEAASGEAALAQWTSLIVAVGASVALAVVLRRYVARELARVV